MLTYSSTHPPTPTPTHTHPHPQTHTHTHPPTQTYIHTLLRGMEGRSACQQLKDNTNQCPQVWTKGETIRVARKQNCPQFLQYVYDEGSFSDPHLIEGPIPLEGQFVLEQLRDTYSAVPTNEFARSRQEITMLPSSSRDIYIEGSYEHMNT